MRNFSGDTLKAAEGALQINAGQTTPDGIFSLSVCGCLGNCTEGPSVMIDDKIHAKIMPRDIKSKISDMKNNPTE